METSIIRKSGVKQWSHPVANVVNRSDTAFHGAFRVSCFINECISSRNYDTKYL